MYYNQSMGRLWMATTGGGLAACKFGSSNARNAPYFDQCDHYRANNHTFVVTNNVIDFQFIAEDTANQMLWTLSRPETASDGSTSAGGVGVLRSSGLEYAYGFPSGLERPLDLEQLSQIRVGGVDELVAAVGFEVPKGIVNVSSTPSPLGVIRWGDPAGAPETSSFENLIFDHWDTASGSTSPRLAM